MIVWWSVVELGMPSWKGNGRIVENKTSEAYQTRQGRVPISFSGWINLISTPRIQKKFYSPRGKNYGNNFPTHFFWSVIGHSSPHPKGSSLKERCQRCCSCAQKDPMTKSNLSILFIKEISREARDSQEVPPCNKNHQVWVRLVVSQFAMLNHQEPQVNERIHTRIRKKLTIRIDPWFSNKKWTQRAWRLKSPHGPG